MFIIKNVYVSPQRIVWDTYLATEVDFFYNPSGFFSGLSYLYGCVDILNIMKSAFVMTVNHVLKGFKSFYVETLSLMPYGLMNKDNCSRNALSANLGILDHYPMIITYEYEDTLMELITKC